MLRASFSRSSRWCHVWHLAPPEDGLWCHHADSGWLAADTWHSRLHRHPTTCATGSLTRRPSSWRTRLRAAPSARTACRCGAESRPGPAFKAATCFQHVIGADVVSMPWCWLIRVETQAQRCACSLLCLEPLATNSQTFERNLTKALRLSVIRSDFSSVCAALQSAKVLPCGHIFHAPCLGAWLQTSGQQKFTCPICRANLASPAEDDGDATAHGSEAGPASPEAYQPARMTRAVSQVGPCSEAIPTTCKDASPVHEDLRSSRTADFACITRMRAYITCDALVPSLFHTVVRLRRRATACRCWSPTEESISGRLASQLLRRVSEDRGDGRGRAAGPPDDEAVVASAGASTSSGGGWLPPPRLWPQAGAGDSSGASVPCI